MGIDYHYFQAFAFSLKSHTVRRDELQLFLEAHPEYCWDKKYKILYHTLSYHRFWDDRLSAWCRWHGESPWADDDAEGEDYFTGMEVCEAPEGSTVPDHSAAEQVFGDRLLTKGWVTVGYTC